MSTPAPTPSAPPAKSTLRSGCLLPVAVLFFLLSVLVNVVFLLGYTGAISDPLAETPDTLNEQFYLGDTHARDKVAIVRVSGVITDGGIAYPVQQLRAAAADRHVKVVVLRVDSPGGTVTASEELYQCILNLRDNTGRRFPGTGPKPVSVSMGGLATSGGYYIATAGNPIVAEKTTITGSIGVFAALPNVAGWAHKNGVKLELVKAGGIKASGSFFHDLGPEERQTWQDTVDNAYDEFLKTIAAGRPGLNPDALQHEPVIQRVVQERDEKGNPKLVNGKAVDVKYTRVRADGGTFTAQQAHQFKLIDGIEDLPNAIRNAAVRAGLSSFKAIVYERPQGLVEKLTGVKVQGRGGAFEIRDVSANLTPRLWYLAPTADAGLLAPNP
ncbi:Putative signal peptide peptidase SppA [Gemmata sp. SH-PL17]|uniref:S49 family peptidase n=1 Tax=Gemmata sp. SH-PL17 TaxID=1630693 RepID=UPI00078EA4A8|nr:S49 family peptidase [Gemmata sp. SH-PL17]AMV25075.1 Putative signal peptide peptidase SppA [Gemmata sp. SH-PL17]